MKKHEVICACIFIFIVLLSGANASGEKQDAKEVEEEIIKVLDMLEDYDLLINMDLYEDKEKTNDTQTINPNTEEKAKRGNSEKN
ncbi:MAG: hypothetical protein HZA10_07615 [Nitrospirae bacterium]|nr:hypothetical protein [Nitrospirota bacterium]